MSFWFCTLLLSIPMGFWSASLLVCRCLYTTRSSQLAPTAKKKKKDHQPPNLSTNHAGSHLAVIGFCHLSNPYNHIITFNLFIFFNAGMRTVVTLVVSDGTRVPVKPLYTLTPFHSAKKNFVWNFSDFILFYFFSFLPSNHHHNLTNSRVSPLHQHTLRHYTPFTPTHTFSHPFLPPYSNVRNRERRIPLR